MTNKRKKIINVIAFLSIFAAFIIGLNKYNAEEDRKVAARAEMAEMVKMAEIKRKKEMLLKQEALQQRNAQWEALNSEGRLAFRQNEYKKIVESLVSNSPGENDAICFHAGVEVFGNDRAPRHHYIQAFRYEWMNEKLFNRLLIQMYAKITKLPQREEHETREILELFYKKHCRT